MILNRQRRVRIQIKILEKFVERARRAVRLPAESFSVCLVTNAEIARWNRRYRGKKGPTDVLSFPAEGSRAAKRGSASATRRRRAATRGDYLGDIAIAPQVAQSNASNSGRTLDEELRVLALHGILHLMGYDHETDMGQMERRERQLRRALRLA